MSKKVWFISIFLLVLVVCVVIGIRFLNGDSPSFDALETSPVYPDSIAEEVNIENFVDHEAHVQFFGFGNGYIYIVDDHCGTFLSTSDVASGVNSAINPLNPAYRGAIDYFANNDSYGRYYAIYDTYYYEVTDGLSKDMYKKFPLDTKFQGGGYYFTANGYFYMISTDKKSLRRTTDLSNATGYYEIGLPKELQDANEYFGWNGRFYVVNLPSNIVRSYTSLEYLENPQEFVFSEQIQDYLPYHNYSGHWEQVWDYTDVTSQREITTTYQVGVTMSEYGGEMYQPANLEEIKRAERHFYCSVIGKSLQTTEEVWNPIQVKNQTESIAPPQDGTKRITKWQWVITYDNYRQSKQYKVYTESFRQTTGELPPIPLNINLKTPPIASLPSGKPDNGTVQLNWLKAHTNDSTLTFKYNVYRSEFKDGDKTLLTTTPILENTFIDTTVEDEKIYYYWIKTVNENGIMSPYSDPSKPVYVDTLNKIAFLGTSFNIQQPDSADDTSETTIIDGVTESVAGSVKSSMKTT